MRRLILVLPLILVLSLGVPLSRPGPVLAQDDVAVRIFDFAFDPDTLEVQVGTTVTWTNNDGAPHTVTADDGSFESENLDTGESFSFTFDEAGTFTYHCAIHPGMTATVMVTEDETETETETETGAEAEATPEDEDEPVDDEDTASEAEETPPAPPTIEAVPAPTVASPQADGSSVVVGATANGTPAVWILGKIEQRGPNFNVLGYLTHVEGLDTAALFTDANPENWNETTARFTLFGTATMTERFILEDRIFAVRAEGTLTFYLNPNGASFDTPEAFFSGTAIAEADLVFRNVISVYAPQEGISTGSGELTFTDVEPFDLDGASFQLGEVGQDNRAALTGLGTLTDPVEPRSTIDVSVSVVTAGTADAIAADGAAGVGVTVALATLNNSGVEGEAILTADGEQTNISIELSGAAGDHPTHIHVGTCENLDPNPAFPLQSVAADGTSETSIDVPLAELTASDFAINIHESVENVGNYIACGDIPRE